MIESILNNHILRALPRTTVEKWLQHSKFQTLQAGETLHRPGTRLNRVYFPLTAILTWVNLLQSGNTTALAMVGHEGAVDWPNPLSLSSHLIVQCTGTSLLVPRVLVDEALQQWPMATKLRSDMTQALITQIGQTAACNRHHALEQQLIRLLLFTLDRSAGNTVHMTQEQMARMLGARREGVTYAASLLQHLGIIEYSRGRITVHDRNTLTERSCECYEVVARAYSTLRAQQACSPPLPPQT